MPVDPISLEVFKNLFISVAEEMGVALCRTAYSPNIKERRDYSCALFDPQGQMVAQAAHIPVHLGAMPFSVQAAIERLELQPGDVAILNDPYLGGTHLPDITLVAPVFVGEGSPFDSAQDRPFDPAQGKQRRLAGFVANRGHHADVGGMTPGSLPLSTELYQEGTIIPPLKLARRGRLNREVIQLICRNSRTPEERKGDLAAQLASVRVGQRRLEGIVERYGLETTLEHMEALLDYSERLTRAAIRAIPPGTYRFADSMDDDGLTNRPVPIAVAVTVQGDQVTVDFSGTAPQTDGCINAPLAITVSAVLYVLRCITGEEVPANQGCLRPVKVVAPPESLVNPSPQRAVAGGNVETSQRITDVLLGALAQALPHLIPAASQGTMNNLLVGGHDPVRDKPFVYYETVGGGTGAGPAKDGASGIQSHMTNTMNTPIEALEFVYPLRMQQYRIRRGSGGPGRFRGGDGIIKDMEFLSQARVTILSERRRLAPWGLQGGGSGAQGENVLLRGGVEEVYLSGKVTLDVAPGDVLSIRTPGGGGWGSPQRDAP
ncbi:MAG: hydantoinase B/oxoprolinase family protein [Dehalococcoidia bacterium]